MQSPSLCFGILWGMCKQQKMANTWYSYRPGITLIEGSGIYPQIKQFFHHGQQDQDIRFGINYVIETW